MPAAEPLQDWVFEQILHSIAKTGEYKLNAEQKIEAIFDEVDITNRAATRKMLLKACDQTKDQDKVDNGKLGGQKCQENIRMIKKENAALKKENAELKDKYRQKKLDLDYFRVLSKCLDP